MVWKILKEALTDEMYGSLLRTRSTFSVGKCTDFLFFYLSLSVFYRILWFQQCGDRTFARNINSNHYWSSNGRFLTCCVGWLGFDSQHGHSFIYFFFWHNKYKWIYAVINPCVGARGEKNPNHPRAHPAPINPGIYGTDFNVKRLLAISPMSQHH